MTDIRAWLRENRPDLDVKPKGAIKNEALAAYREANAGDDVSRETSPGETSPDESVSRETTAGEVAPEASGRAPWFGKRAAPRAPGAKVTHRRVPVDGLLSMAWAGLGKLAAQPAILPVGRCMQLQAPAAGMVLDDALKGSILDRMAQPLARGAKRGELVFAVAGPPILVGAVCQRPELYPVVRPMLVEALKSWLIVSGPRMRKAREREAKLIAEMQEEGMDAGSIEEMIDALFAPPPGAEVGADDDAPARAA